MQFQVRKVLEQLASKIGKLEVELALTQAGKEAAEAEIADLNAQNTALRAQLDHATTNAATESVEPSVEPPVFDESDVVPAQ